MKKYNGETEGLGSLPVLPCSSVLTADRKPIEHGMRVFTNNRYH